MPGSDEDADLGGHAPRARRSRRSWPQRLLIVAGLVVSGGCLAAAAVVWNASTVLSTLPRISVGADALAVSGGPGDPVNFLMIGVDSAVGLDEDDPIRTGRELDDEARGIVRPDTILVVRADPATGEAAIVSVPRDLIVIGPSGDEIRINGVQAIAGVEGLISTIDENWQIPINHFVMVDFAGFTDLVDLVDGVPIDFPHPARDTGSGLSVPAAGCWALDGPQALAYVRSRSLEQQIDGEWVRVAAAAPDIARIERQQLFLVLALEKLLATIGSDVGRIREVVEAATQAVTVDQDLTAGEMLELAEAFREFDTDVLRVDTLPREPRFADDGTYLGESLVVLEATPLLATLRGQGDGVRPNDIALNVFAASADQANRVAEQFGERGFAAVSGAETTAEVTTLRFDPSEAASALLVARYLSAPPIFEPAIDAQLDVAIGPDFAGIRTTPRPVADLEAAFREAIDAMPARSAVQPADAAEQDPAATSIAPDPSTTTEPTTTIESGDIGQTTSSTVPPEPTDVNNGPATPIPTSSIVQPGRPPEGARCVPVGG